VTDAYLHGAASYQPRHQPDILPTTGWPLQQLTSFCMKNRHCVPAGKHPGGGVPATGSDGVLVATTTAPTTATATTTMMTTTHQITPRCAFMDALMFIFMLELPTVGE
jgi:hypothetical protein